MNRQPARRLQKRETLSDGMRSLMMQRGKLVEIVLNNDFEQPGSTSSFVSIDSYYVIYREHFETQYIPRMVI
jgi:hypothetical protein